MELRASEHQDPPQDAELQELQDQVYQERQEHLRQERQHRTQQQPSIRSGRHRIFGILHYRAY